MNFKTIIIILLCFNIAVKRTNAQIKTTTIVNAKSYNQKLQDWKNYCKQILELASAGKNNVTFLTFVDCNKKGLLFCKKNDTENLAYFNYYIGAGFQNASKPDSAVSYLENSVKQYHQINFIKKEVNSMRYLHYAYFYSGNFLKRDSMINKMRVIFASTKDVEIKTTILETLSEYAYDHANYESAISYKLKCRVSQRC